MAKGDTELTEIGGAGLGFGMVEVIKEHHEN